MGIGLIAGILGAGFGLGMMLPPAQRAMAYNLNTAIPNEILAPGEAVTLFRRGLIEPASYEGELRKRGFDDQHQSYIYSLTNQILGISELITLYRRGEIKDTKALYREANKAGWGQGDVDYMLRITEVIPTAGDIIRYAVREVYSPEIAQAFGQFDGLDEVTKLAKTDLEAAGLPKTTFDKEWAAHWLLPSIMQGFEMLHRGVIPNIATPNNPLSLERLMTALDIMPAWRDKLTAISYSPYTRVDVRRMHKIGVLDTKEMFMGYADAGFSPYADGETHKTREDAFECETCRHNSKAGRMTDFTLIYNNDPEASELTIADRDRQADRELTKAEVLAGYREGLLEQTDVETALTSLEYTPETIAYLISKADYDKDKVDSSLSLSYIHTAYVKGIIGHTEAVELLGGFNLPDKQVQYLFSIWDLDKKVRTLKPTKSELAAFLRAEIIEIGIYRSEMQSLGYPAKYIKWYEELIEHARAKKEATGVSSENEQGNESG